MRLARSAWEGIGLIQYALVLGLVGVVVVGAVSLAGPTDRDASTGVTDSPDGTSGTGGGGGGGDPPDGISDECRDAWNICGPGEGLCRDTFDSCVPTCAGEDDCIAGCTDAYDACVDTCNEALEGCPGV